MSFCRTRRSQTSKSLAGNQYYSSRNAKLLGNDESDSSGLWLIDSGSFAAIRNKYGGITRRDARRELQLARTKKITVDNYVIQADLQRIHDSTLSNKREYQMYIYIDRLSGIISSIRDSSATGENDSYPELIISPDSGVNYPKIGNWRPASRILIAQAHGHPSQKDSIHITISGISEKDKKAAWCLQTPIYAIDAMDGVVGSPGDIHRANPDTLLNNSEQHRIFGKTQGKGSNYAGKIFDIGLDAFEIWSRSQRPNFKCMKEWDEQLRKGYVIEKVL
ncbi:MAG TPA: hypothetical protein VGN00_23880 [Puia sp.]|jgi:hypothetical protein